MGESGITGEKGREIVETATTLFFEKGYDNTSMDDVAAYLRIDQDVLRRHFPEKLDLVSSVVDYVIMRTTEDNIAEPPESAASLDEYRDYIKRLGSRVVNSVRDNPKMYYWFFTEAPRIDETIAVKVNAVMTLLAAYTEKVIQIGMARGFLRPDVHAYQASFAINGMIFEAIRKLSQEPETIDSEQQAWHETIVSLMLDGLEQRP